MTETLETKQKLSFEELRQLDAAEIATSEAFLEWAGHDWQNTGEVVSADDKPTVFFHGGSPGIVEFNRDNPRNTGQEQKGIYFSPRVDDARFYADKLKAEQIEEGQMPDSSIYAVVLKMKNPYVVGSASEINSHSLDQIPMGYDGVINQRSQEVVVFDPSQVLIVAET